MKTIELLGGPMDGVVRSVDVLATHVLSFIGDSDQLVPGQQVAVYRREPGFSLKRCRKYRFQMYTQFDPNTCQRA